MKGKHKHDQPELASGADPDLSKKPGAPFLPSRQFAFALVTVLGSVVAGLVLLEIGMRVMGIKPERYQKSYNVVVEAPPGSPVNAAGQNLVKRPSRFRDKGIQMGEWVPGEKFKTVYSSNPRGTFDPDNSVPVDINASGFRGPDVSSQKPAETFRILGIGDSFTFGIGVRDKDTFLRQLERELNEKPTTAGVRFEVMNTGVEGYNTADEVIALEHHWMQFHPDLILLTFYLNDAYSDFTFLNRGEAQGLYLEKGNGLARYSYLWDYFQHRRKTQAESRRIQAFYEGQYFARPETVLKGAEGKGDWQASRRALARAAELAQTRKIPLVLVIFPELYQLNDRYPFKRVHELVKETGKELQLPVLDLLETFHGESDKDLWVHPSDHHPNEKAHALAAGAIERFLKEEVLK